MAVALWLLLGLLGHGLSAVLAYRLFRRVWVNEGLRWTKADRTINLTLACLFGIVSLVAALACCGIDAIERAGNETASW